MFSLAMIIVFFVLVLSQLLPKKGKTMLKIEALQVSIENVFKEYCEGLLTEPQALTAISTNVADFKLARIDGLQREKELLDEMLAEYD